MAGGDAAAADQAVKIAVGEGTVEEKMAAITKIRGLNQKQQEKISAHVKKIGTGTGSILEKNVELVKVQEKSRLEWELAEAIQSKVVTNIKMMTFELDKKINMQSQYMSLAQSETALAEKSVAGHAMSFKARYKEYRMLGKQIEYNTERTKLLREAELQAITGRDDKTGKAAAFNKEFAEELKMLQSSNAETQAEGMARLSNAWTKLGIKEKSKQDELREYYMNLVNLNKERVASERQVNIEMGKQRDMVLAMKEGYLDVINEMTTGSDLVSKLMPDAQRGLVSLHQFAMGAGDMQAGALRRGFASVDMSGMTDLSQAARYHGGGLKGATHRSLLQKRHWESIQERSRGPQSSFFGVLSPDARGGYMGLASGGLIPGAPSFVDNMLGMINGRQPIGLAGGEYVVNAQQTRKNLSLLEMINSGQLSQIASKGLSGGNMPSSMRIGALYLNGKVIGQDISSGPSDEWTMAMQNANG
jgi:hypothetical protein